MSLPFAGVSAAAPPLSASITPQPAARETAAMETATAIAVRRERATRLMRVGRAGRFRRNIRTLTSGAFRDVDACSATHVSERQRPRAPGRQAELLNERARSHCALRVKK